MNEDTFEDIICKYPELIENGLSFKGRQVTVHGKRIDVLFEDRHGQKLIVEIKKGTVLRSHVGQLLDYEGHFVSADNPDVRVMLVGNRVPENLRRSLNHHGFEWKEFAISTLDHFLNEKEDFDLLNGFLSKDPPIRDNQEITLHPGSNAQKKSQREASFYDKKIQNNIDIESLHDNIETFSFEDICGSVSPEGVAFAQSMSRDSITPIKNFFKEYRVSSSAITGLVPSKLHFVLENDPSQESGTRRFRRGNTWWAYSFGLSDGRNDVPNISINGFSTSLDVALDAEIQPSQKIMIDRVQKATSEFDRLLNDHGGLWLKTYLKFEHQPRIYHWISADMRTPGEFDGSAILQIRLNHERAFIEERERWIRFIIRENKELTPGQIHHLETHNKRLNLAMRLSDSIQEKAPFWSLSYGMKVSEIVGAVKRLKPLIDFFLRY